VDDVREWLLRHLPWYSPEAQARRQARTEQSHHRALVVRISVEKVLDDYAKAETMRSKS
jgi:hypothetical protein